MRLANILDYQGSTLKHVIMYVNVKDGRGNFQKEKGPKNKTKKEVGAGIEPAKDQWIGECSLVPIAENPQVLLSVSLPIPILGGGGVDHCTNQPLEVGNVWLIW